MKNILTNEVPRDEKKESGGGGEVIKRENVRRGFLAENILKNVNGIKRIEKESLCKRD